MEKIATRRNAREKALVKLGEVARCALIGGIIGFSLGLLFFIVGLLSRFSTVYQFTIGLPFLFAETLGATYLGYSGWGRLTPHLLGGVLIYALLGSIASTLFDYLRRK